MKFASALLAVAVAAGAAHGAEAIRAGKWEISAQVQLPNIPKLPPGITLPPGISMGAGGVNVTRTTCLTESKPVPDDIRPPHEQKGDCKVEKLDKQAGTVNWETTCKTPDATVHSKGTAHYAGDKMEATIKTIVSNAGGRPNESSQHMTGRYLGPCDAK
jgi:Protein of unknown function (DUF3617)